jgi:hypothetical protein
LWAPNGCSATNKMSMELLKETRHDLWQKVIPKLNV